MRLLVPLVPGVEFFATQSTMIWILTSMTAHASHWVVPGDDFCATQITDTWIFTSNNVHVLFLVVSEDELPVTQNTKNCPQNDSSCVSLYDYRG